MKWKKLLLPGLSGLVLGAVAVVAGKRRQKKRLCAPRRIPEGVSVRIETDERLVVHHRDSYQSRVVYGCKPTQFRVWSLLDEPPKEGGVGGSLIYLVAPLVELKSDTATPQTLAEPRFYATIQYRPQGRLKPLASHLAIGSPVEFHKCHVGGSMNGIDTGETVVTTAVTSFSFEEQV